MSGYVCPDPDELEPLMHLPGVTLIPLPARSKRPTVKEWTTKDFTALDPNAHMNDKDGNVGVRLDREALVVDVDPKNGGDASFQRLCADIGLDPEIFPTVETGSGGQHLYMRVPSGVMLRTTLPEYPGIDFKSGNGHQVVAPGSVHPETNRHYRWVRNEDDIPCFGLPMAPKALLGLLAALRLPARNSSAASSEDPIAPEDLERMLGVLDPENFQDHGDWLPVMQACHEATGGLGEDEFVLWSTSDPAYVHDEQTIRTRWRSLGRNKNGRLVTRATLFQELIGVGRRDLVPANGSTDADTTLGRSLMKEGLALSKQGQARNDFTNAIRAVSGDDLMLAFNELKQRAVFLARLPWDSSYGRDLDDQTLLMLRLYVMEKYKAINYQPAEVDIRNAAQTVAFGNKFNPILDYLNGLEWDGVPRIERLFPDYLGTADTEYARTIGKIFMVGAVRRQRQPGCKFDTMPILKGGQGVGKSSAVKLLFGADWHSDAPLGDVKNKDAAILLQGIWVHELSELDDMRRNQANSLKAYCSRAVDRYRPVHGKLPLDVPRRMVFFGTVNESGFLKDSTGARRFWPVDVVGEIDRARIAIDRDQLWAEATHLEATGMDIELPRELWGVAAEHQAAETSDDPWADMVRQFLHDRDEEHELFLKREGSYAIDEGSPPPPPNKVHTAELLRWLDVKGGQASRDNSSRLRSVMEREIGWVYNRGLTIPGRGQSSGYEKPAF